MGDKYFLIGDFNAKTCEMQVMQNEWINVNEVINERM